MKTLDSQTLPFSIYVYNEILLKLGNLVMGWLSCQPKANNPHKGLIVNFINGIIFFKKINPSKMITIFRCLEVMFLII